MSNILKYLRGSQEPVHVTHFEHALQGQQSIAQGNALGNLIYSIYAL